MLHEDEHTTIVTLIVRPRQGPARRVAVGEVWGTVDSTCDYASTRARVVGGLLFRGPLLDLTEVLVEQLERGRYEVVVRRVAMGPEEPASSRRAGSFEVGDADSFRMRVLRRTPGQAPRPLLECPWIHVEDIPRTAPPPVRVRPARR